MDDDGSIEMAEWENIKPVPLLLDVKLNINEI